MPKIEALYAFVVEDEGPEDEGVVGISVGAWVIPLIGADLERIASYRTRAEQVARITDHPVKLLKFSAREVLEKDIRKAR